MQESDCKDKMSASMRILGINCASASKCDVRQSVLRLVLSVRTFKHGTPACDKEAKADRACV